MRVGRQDRQKPKRISGVIVGAALCCLPGATLGSMYDDWRAAKEAPELERRARERQANRQRERRCASLHFCAAEKDAWLSCAWLLML